MPLFRAGLHRNGLPVLSEAFRPIDEPHADIGKGVSDLPHACLRWEGLTRGKPHADHCRESRSKLVRPRRSKPARPRRCRPASAAGRIQTPAMGMGDGGCYRLKNVRRRLRSGIDYAGQWPAWTGWACRGCPSRMDQGGRRPPMALDSVLYSLRSIFSPKTRLPHYRVASFDSVRFQRSLGSEKMSRVVASVFRYIACGGTVSRSPAQQVCLSEQLRSGCPTEQTSRIAVSCIGREHRRRIATRIWRRRWARPTRVTNIRLAVSVDVSEAG